MRRSDCGADGGREKPCIISSSSVTSPRGQYIHDVQKSSGILYLPSFSDTYYMIPSFLLYIACHLGPLLMWTLYVQGPIHPSPLGRPGSSSRGSFSEKGKVLAAQHDIVTYFWLRWRRWGSRQAEKGREQEEALSPSLSGHTNRHKRGHE